MQSLHLFEIELIRCLQQIRSPLLDKFFVFLNFFDTFYFYLMIIPIIWMAVNWRWGLKIMFLLLISYLVNELAKGLFAQPRPFNLDPAVGIITVKGYGFPSGAVQSATIYSGLIISHLKNKKWAWVLGINVIFWLGLSRVYLGVHFFTDLLGGFIIGLTLVFIFNYLSPKAEIFLSKTSIFNLFIINLLVCFLLFILGLPLSILISICSFLVISGLIVSKIFNVLLPDTRSFWEGVLKLFLFFIGTAVLVAIVINLLPNLSKKAHLLINSALMGIWLSFGINVIWKTGFSKLKYFKK